MSISWQQPYQPSVGASDLHEAGGQESMMYDIVWISPESDISLSVKHHLLQKA